MWMDVSAKLMIFDFAGVLCLKHIIWVIDFLIFSYILVSKSLLYHFVVYWFWRGWSYIILHPFVEGQYKEY